MATQTLDYETDRELETEGGGHAPADPEQRITRGPKKSGRKFIVIGVLLVVIAGSAVLWLRSRNKVSTDDAQVDGHIAPVSAKISGNVLEVLVNDNQSVKKGDVLLRLDPRDYQARVNQAKAALLVAQSQAHGAAAGVPLTRETTLSGTSGAEAQVSAAQADYERAKVDYQMSANADIAMEQANADAALANAERAQADLNRMKPLVDKAEISKLQYDSYVAAAKVAESQLQAARQKLTAASQQAETKKSAVLAAEARVAQARAGVHEAQANQQQVVVRSADAASASANVEQARANLEAAELSLSYATIVAPMDGVVTKKSIEVGQIVQPGQGLMMVVPLQDVWVTANYKETQLRDVQPGQKVEIKVDLTGRTYAGRVDSISGATGTRMSLLPPENATGNYIKVVQRIPVKIVLDPIAGGNNVLRPGMNVEATIVTR